MAESILNRLGHGKFRAFSAGSSPRGYVHPLALQILRKSNYDVSQLRSKAWDEFATTDAPKLDFVFTLCDAAAMEPCPALPGQPMSAHWGLPDPAEIEGYGGRTGSRFRRHDAHAHSTDRNFREPSL
jgi:protein-tyrosine-phosphatase